MKQQSSSKANNHEDRYHHYSQGKDELVKRDMLDPPRYLRRRNEDNNNIRGKALSFGVLDWKQLEKWKDDNTKGPPCCSYASSYNGSSAVETSLELDLSTGVVKRLELLDSKPPRTSCTSPPCSLIFSQRETSGHDIEAECSNLVDQNIPIVTTSTKGRRQGSPNRRFSFSFSQMSRSKSSKESLPSVSSVKSGPLTYAKPTKSYTHNRSRSGPLQTATKAPEPIPQTMEKNRSSERVHALLQFTLRKGINLFQFVVQDNKSDNNVLAATMKSSDSSTRTYTLYSVNQVKNKSGGNWLNRNKNNPFVHTVIGHMKTVTSFATDSETYRSESVLLSVEGNEEVAAIVQTRNKNGGNCSVILPSGVHTLPKDGISPPLPLIERWSGLCDCGGWDIGCKLRVLSSGFTKSQCFSSFQLFDQERDEPEFKIVTHDDELHSVEFGSSISLLEAFFISLAVSCHRSWCEEEAVLIGDGLLKRDSSAKYATNPPVSPIGRV